MAVGEVGLADPDRMARYYGGDGALDELQLAFNFPFWSQPWSAGGFRDTVAAVQAALPVGAWPAYALSNHDLPRAASRYDHDGHGPARARLAAMLLLTLRGTPFLYYGEEIGMTDVALGAEQARDPDGRDACRTPMQWDGSAGAGFTSCPGRSWLALPASARTVNVAAQRRDPASLLNLYRELLAVRRGHRQALPAAACRPAPDRRWQRPDLAGPSRARPLRWVAR